jgi:hypothetical protein
VATLDLNDVNNLQFNVVNAQQQPANATAVTLTITLPDGTVVTPAIGATPVQTGAYLYSYISVQAGRHQVQWIATGSNAMAYNDVFDVRPANPGMIFSLADARDTIREPSTITVNDDKIRDYIAAVTAVVESLYGIVVQRSFTEQRRGGTDTISLNYRPVVSITSATEYIAGAAYPLVQAATPILSGYYGFTFDPLKGSITRRNSGGLRLVFMDEVWITYVAGLTVIPDNVLMASRIILRHFWLNLEEGRSSARGQTGSDTVAVMGYAVPRFAAEMLGIVPLAPGFA